MSKKINIHNLIFNKKNTKCIFFKNYNYLTKCKINNEYIELNLIYNNILKWYYSDESTNYFYDNLSIHNTYPGFFIAIYKNNDIINFILIDLYNYSNVIPYDNIEKNIIYNDITNRRIKNIDSLEIKNIVDLKLEDFLEEKIRNSFFIGEPIRKYKNTKIDLIERFIGYICSYVCSSKYIPFNKPIYIDTNVYKEILLYNPSYINIYDLKDYTNLLKMRSLKLKKLKIYK